MAVEANVRESVNNVLTYPGHREAHERGEFEVVGAVYDTICAQEKSVFSMQSNVTLPRNRRKL